MARVLVYIANQMFARNYLQKNAFADIMQKHDVVLLGPEELEVPAQFEEICVVKKVEIPQKDKAVSYQIFDLLMFANAHKSKTFAFRIERQFFPWFPRHSSLSLQTLGKSFRHFLVRLKLLLMWSALKIQSLPPFLDFSLARLSRAQRRESELSRFVDEYAPEAILVPTSSCEHETMCLLGKAIKDDIKFMMVVDNWDNLSSKTVLQGMPTRMTVWGAQSKRHAIDIQGVDEDRVDIIGTARFDTYFEKRGQSSPAPFNFPYILFVGTALAFNEGLALSHWNDVVERHKDKLGGLKVIYRPHPYRHSREIVDLAKLSNVMLDPQMQESYQAEFKKTEPDLDYYPSLLGNAEFVTGGLTSMLIEALIMNKHFVCQAYEDRNYHANMANVRRNYIHFDGLEDIDAFHYVNNEAELEDVFLSVWQNRNEIDQAKHDAALDHFVHITSTNYNARLAGVLDDMIQAG